MQSISAYNDYKLYLRDVYKHKLNSRHGFSFSVWAKSLDISSPSTLSMIINGKRHPSKNITSKLAHYLELTEEELSFFEGLIQLQKSKSNPHLTIHLNQTNMASLSSDNHYLSISTFIIRELLNNRDLSKPVDFVLKNMNGALTEVDVKAKIDFLLEKKLIVEKNGHYKASGNIFEQIVSNTDGILKFHKSTMQENVEAFSRTKIEERAFHTSILSIKESKIQEAKELLKEFQHKMTDFLESDDEPGDQIYILNMNLYPTTKIIQPE